MAPDSPNRMRVVARGLWVPERLESSSDRCRSLPFFLWRHRRRLACGGSSRRPRGALSPHPHDQWGTLHRPSVGSDVPPWNPPAMRRSRRAEPECVPLLGLHTESLGQVQNGRCSAPHGIQLTQQDPRYRGVIEPSQRSRTLRAIMNVCATIRLGSTIRRSRVAKSCCHS